MVGEVTSESANALEGKRSYMDSPAVNAGEKCLAGSLANIDSDVLRTHVFTRLDGSSLAAIASTSTLCNALATQESLWSNMCNSKWPSTTTLRLREVISTFPGGHRSFFSDCFTIALSDFTDTSSSTLSLHRPSEIISAVDLYHRGNLIFSKTIDTETVSGWFLCSPFRIDMLEPKEIVHTPIVYTNNENASKELEEDLTLSWIVIEPISRRAINLSSQKPVSVQRHWLSGEVKARFSSILSGERGSARECVECGITVTCGESERGELQVREVSLQVEDMDETHLNGKDSLVIIRRALEGKRGNGKNTENGGRRRHEEYLNTKKEWKESKIKRERRLDMTCVSFAIFGLASFCFYHIYLFI